METTIIQSANGAHVADGPLTTSITNEAAPGLLRNAIDDRIVKVRPMATPIDQISRCAGARMCGSMKVDYYSVDTKPTHGKVVSAVAEKESLVGKGESVIITLETSKNSIFEPSETLLIPSVSVPMDGSDKTSPLVLYVLSRDNTEGLQTVVVNPISSGGGSSVMFFNPAIPAGAEIVRMGRAATELDVQTAQFEAIPTKKSNNCQIFKMQVEQSTFQKMANKEVGWNFSDQEEVAIIDMRLGMEKNFLFGQKATIYDENKREDVLLTGGIWNQTEKEFVYPTTEFSNDTIIDMCRMAFTENAGSNRKILIAGTGLVDLLSKLRYDKVLTAGETFTKWGLEFNEIRSNFGSLFVIHSEIFDQCGHYFDGFVLDPDYVSKYCHVPFHAESLDLRRCGIRNTDAIVITEASCLVLRHPDSHMRVIGSQQP